MKQFSIKNIFLIAMIMAAACTVPEDLKSPVDSAGISSVKEFTAFSFKAENNSFPIISDVDGSINNGDYTVLVTVPENTDVTALTASFSINGFVVKVSGEAQPGQDSSPRDFTNPVVYTVVATDNSTIDYTVTINSASNAPAAPEALAVSITGTTEVLRMLTGNYTYSDLNGNPESGSTYQWYRADALAGPYTVIAGATDSAYVLTTSDETKYIKFEVTPITATAPTTGTPVEATPVGPVGADSYYAGANLLTGDPLKSAFHNIIKGHTEFSYDELWSHLSYTDEDVSNTDNVILIHTGWSIPKTSMATGDDANNDAYWNREHVWAKYHGDFGTDTGPGTDLHHLRPSDRSVNSARGNLYFDDGGTAYVDDSAATGCFKNGSTSWEPRDAVKGDIARMIFYMAARYEGEAATDHSYDLELETGTSGGADPYHGNMETLLEWHEADPVDLTEYRRNERIFELQGNRNPFIDYPDTVSKIWFTLPELDGAVAESSTTVKITFSKAVDETIAETIGNYGIDGGLMVFSAVLDANNVDLVLTTSAQTLSQAYTITVNNVEDTDNHVITANSTVDFTGFNPGNTYVNLTNYTLVMAGNDSKEVVVNCGAVDPYGEGGGMFLNGSFVVMVRGGASYNTFDEWDTVITAKDFDLSIRNRVYYVNATHPNYSGESDDGAVIRLSGTPVDSFIVGDVNSFGEFKSEHRTRIDIDEFSDNQSTGEFFDVTTSPADMTGYTHPVYIWEMADSNTTDLPTYETSYVIFYIP